MNSDQLLDQIDELRSCLPYGWKALPLPQHEVALLTRFEHYLAEHIDLTAPIPEQFAQLTCEKHHRLVCRPCKRQARPGYLLRSDDYGWAWGWTHGPRLVFRHCADHAAVHFADREHAIAAMFGAGPAAPDCRIMRWLYPDRLVNVPMATDSAWSGVLCG